MKNNYYSSQIKSMEYKNAAQLFSFLENNDIDLHSLLIYKEGSVVFERYYGIADGGRTAGMPNSPYVLHRMYSITKSVTAIAIGILAKEGQILLSDRIVDYYPQIIKYREFEGKVLSKDDFSEALLKTRIEDLLSMRSCHTKTTYKVNMENDWVNSFFEIPTDKMPGEKFNYDTSAYHVLGALVEMIAGMDSWTLIKNRMPMLELSDASYIIKDPFGVNAGGDGLMCTPRDLLSFGKMILEGGKYNGTVLIDEDYVSKAVSKIVNTDNTAKYPFEANGYGYGFWRHEHNGYMCYGMHGQFIFFLPQEDMIIITTSDTSRVKSGIQILLDGIYDYCV